MIYIQKLEEFKNEIDIYKEDIEDLIDKLNNVKEKFEILYNIYYNMINNYDDKFRNYEIFTNLNSINNNKIIEDLKKINEIKLINNKINDIIKLYEKTNYYEMDIEYEFKKGKKIKIFGNEFVDNNFDNCSIIFENEEYDLSTYFEKKYTYQSILKIKLRSKNNNINLSHMFDGCKSLVSIKDISKWNMNKITDLSFMFSGCSSLQFLPIYQYGIHQMLID